jgi:hypothetical protein
MDHETFLNAIKPYVAVEKFGENEVEIYTVGVPLTYKQFSIYNPTDKVKVVKQPYVPAKAVKLLAPRRGKRSTVKYVITPLGKFEKLADAAFAHGYTVDNIRKLARKDVDKESPEWSVVYHD